MSEHKLNEQFIDDDGLLNKIISITRGGKTRTFSIKEAAFGKLQQLSAAMQQQDDAKRQKAIGDYGALIISASVTENGEKLTYDQAAALPASIGKRLETEVAELNGIVKGGAELDTKNE